MTNKDFDFIEKEKEVVSADAGEEPEMDVKEVSITPEEEKVLIKKQLNEIATSGNPGLTPEVIAEARRLAGSRKGLDINSFFTKHHITCSIERLLNGPLDKDGGLL